MALAYTKMLIREKFIELLNEKPLHNISVTEIAKQCGIERKTFYYHYANIPDLLREIFQDQLQKSIEEFSETLSWEESCISTAKFLLDNKKALKHVYYSNYREDLETYVYLIAGQFMERYMNKYVKDTHAKEEDIQLLTMFYQCALSGAFIHWLQTNMEVEPIQAIRRMGALMDGNILISLKRSEALGAFTHKSEGE